MDIIQYLKPLIAWLHVHPGWTGFVTFLISLTESLAVVGYFVPGSVMMTAIGTLIGAGIIPTWSTMIWAIAGAVVGDGLSYRLGYHFKDRICDLWPINKYPQWITKGEDFFHKHGGKSVFLGRFVGAVRPMVPLIAGMLRMKPLNFFISNVTSAVLWAPAYMVPGILIGAASLELDPKTATELVLWVLVILVLIALSFWLLKRIVYAMINVMHIQLDKLWHWLLRHPSFRSLCLILQNPRHPEGHGQLTMAFGFMLSLVAFLIVLLSVIYHGTLTDINAPIHNFFRTIQAPIMSKIMIAITILGDKLVLLPTSLAIFLALAIQKQWRAALHWAAAIVICAGTAYCLKEIIDSTRPLDILNPTTSNSFPSGHAAVTVIFFGFFAILIAHNYQRNIRIAIYSCSIFLISLINLSRLYLGAHWFTDVLGATLLAISVLLPVTISYRSRQYPTLSLAWVYLMGGLVFLIFYCGNCYVFYQKSIEKYQPIWPSSQVTMKHWWQQNSANPLIRTNRFGRPIHLINIQWAGHLPTISQQLQAIGWLPVPKQTIMNTIGRFAKTSHSKQLPLIPAVYRGQTPALIMVKPASSNHFSLVLQLWDSRTQFTDKEVPLWVGTVNYRLPRLHNFWEYKKYRARYRDLPPAVLQLQPALMGFRWRIIKYPNSLKHKDINGNEWEAGTLLIKPISQTHVWHQELQYKIAFLF